MLRVGRIDFVSYCNDGLSTERAKHVSGLLREYLRSIPSAGWFTPSDITLNTGQAGSVIGVMIRVRPITLSPTNSKDKKFYPPKGRLSKGTWYSYDRIVDIYGLEEVGRDGRAPVKMIAITLSIVLVFLAIVAGLTYFRPTAESTPKPVESTQTEQYVHSKTVPDVVGMNADTARRELGNALYEVKEQYAPSNTVKAGIVISQNPPAGTKTSAPVTIKISSGKEGVYPNLVGLNLDEAKKILETLGVSSDVDFVNISNKPEGVVLESSAKPGSKSSPTDRVRIRVSSGYNNIPSLVGLSKNEAAKVLDINGFKNISIGEKEVSDNSNVGKVIESSPNGGRHKLTEKVSITIGKATTITTPSPSHSTSSIPSTPLPNTSSEINEPES